MGDSVSVAARQKAMAKRGALHDLFLSIYDHGARPGVISEARASSVWGAPWRALLFGFHPQLHFIAACPLRGHGNREHRQAEEKIWSDWLDSEHLVGLGHAAYQRSTCRDLLIRWLASNGRPDAKQRLEARDREASKPLF